MSASKHATAAEQIALIKISTINAKTSALFVVCQQQMEPWGRSLHILYLPSLWAQVKCLASCKEQCSADVSWLPVYLSTCIKPTLLLRVLLFGAVMWSKFISVCFNVELEMRSVVKVTDSCQPACPVLILAGLGIIRKAVLTIVPLVVAFLLTTYEVSKFVWFFSKSKIRFAHDEQLWLLCRCHTFQSDCL